MHHGPPRAASLSAKLLHFAFRYGNDVSAAQKDSALLNAVDTSDILKDEKWLRAPQAKFARV